MSKIFQHLVRISRTRGRAITTTLLSALVLVPAVVKAQAPSTTQFQVLHTFHGSDGYGGTSSVALDTAGNIFGATLAGGDLNCPSNPGAGCGLVFELSTTGKEKVLHKFQGGDGVGALFGGSLTRDSQGNLYGTTVDGGDSSCVCGVIFKIDTTGKETALYKFKGTNGDGAYPDGGIIADGNGNLYGTTSSGGAAGYGTVFKLDKTSKETVLHSFNDTGDGSLPQFVNLVEDAAGNLYGTTSADGISCPQASLAGCGLIFKVDKTGHETVLHKFTGVKGDGAIPHGTLVLDKKGNLYGTTWEGGIGSVGGGTVFKITKTGHETILYSFTGPDGFSPVGGVVFDSAGNLYGTTTVGGSLTYGTVFELTKAGKEKVLHNFSGGKDGNFPFSGVAIDSTGSLYGTTAYGGDLKCTAGQGQGCGVLFKITQ